MLDFRRMDFNKLLTFIGGLRSRALVIGEHFQVIGNLIMIGLLVVSGPFSGPVTGFSN